MAAVTRIDLDEDGVPESVYVKLTVTEAAFIAKFSGGTDRQAEEIMPGGGAMAAAELYSALVGSMFNRFWDNGVDGWRLGDIPS